MRTITHHLKGFCRYLRSTRAISALEYAILIGGVAVAVAAAVTTFTGTISDALNTIGTNISSTVSDVGSSPSTPGPSTPTT